MLKFTQADHASVWIDPSRVVAVLELPQQSIAAARIFLADSLPAEVREPAAEVASLIAKARAA